MFLYRVTIISFVYLTSLTLSNSLFARDACNEESPRTPDIVNCLMIDYEKSDKELNQLYQNIIHDLSSVAKNQFKNSQIRWINSKNACNEFYDMKYGQEGRFSAIVCRTEKTNNRIQYLKNYRNCNQKGSQPSNVKQCLWDAYYKLDKKLNITYATTFSKTSPENQKILKQNEITWIKNKEKICNKNINVKDLSQIECLIEKTQTRILDLENQSNY